MAVVHADSAHDIRAAVGVEVARRALLASRASVPRVAARARGGDCAREAVGHRCRADSAEERRSRIRVIVGRSAGVARGPGVTRVAGVAGSRSNESRCTRIAVGESPSESAGNTCSYITCAIIAVYNSAGWTNDWRSSISLKITSTASIACLS